MLDWFFDLQQQFFADQRLLYYTTHNMVLKPKGSLISSPSEIGKKPFEWIEGPAPGSVVDVEDEDEELVGSKEDGEAHEEDQIPIQKALRGKKATKSARGENPLYQKLNWNRIPEAGQGRDWGKGDSNGEHGDGEVAAASVKDSVKASQPSKKSTRQGNRLCPQSKTNLPKSIPKEKSTAIAQESESSKTRGSRSQKWVAFAKLPPTSKSDQKTECHQTPWLQSNERCVFNSQNRGT